MKRFLYIAVFILLICIVLCDCSQITPPESIDTDAAANAVNEPALIGNILTVFPLAETPASLNIMATAYNGIEQKGVYVWQKYEEKTNVNINWTTTTRDKRSEDTHTALINHQNLDLILRCKLSSNKLTQYGDSGLVLDLAKDDLLKTYAPNCWAYLHSHPDTLASVMNPDGTIYSLPQVNSGAELRVALKLFVNKTWLENVGMELPKTTEEFKNLLIAFKEQDPNRNGDTTDEIPFCSTNWESVQQSLYGAFGLANRGFHNLAVDCDPNTGGVRYIAATDEYKAFLEYISGLYTDGLLDNYVFSITDGQWKSNIANDRIGVFASTNLAWVPADKMDNWVAIDEAIEGPFGDKLWTAIRANFHSAGAAVIPTTCKNPSLVLRWLDYFWTDEGTLFYHMGIEGETFIKKEDGTYDYTPKVYDRMVSENLSFDDAVAAYSPYPGGSNPTVEIAPYFMGGEMASVPAAAAKKLFEYGPEEYWPSFTFTTEEAETLSVLNSDISKYCSAMGKDFVTGKTSFEKWGEYTAQLEKMNLSELLAIYQAAVDRYHALITALG